MKRVLVGALTEVALSLSPFAQTAAVAAGDQSAEAASSERMQHWASNHRAMMDAMLGAMKAAQHIAIRRVDERIGEIVVHFPRAGFLVQSG
jgi:ribonuclease HI